MAPLDIQQLRNIAIVGHGSVGKTTLADALVHQCGQTSRLGKAAEGTSLFDYLEEERSRGISISAAVGDGEHQGHRLTFVDTPGYADFFGEVCAALRVCDAAALVVCSYMGVEVQTERIWRRLQESGNACVVVLNKVDAERADFPAVVHQLSERLGMRAVPILAALDQGPEFRHVLDVVAERVFSYEGGASTEGAVPAEAAEELASYREALCEAAAEGADDLLEKYLEEEALTVDEIWRGLRGAVAAGSCVPVVCVSAEKQVGLDRLLDIMVKCLPAPAGEGRDVVGTKPEGDGEVVRKGTAAEPFSALVFKTITDPYVGRLSYFRVCSGTAKADLQAFNSVRGERERLTQVFRPQGKELQPIGNAGPGELVAVAKLETTRTGDTLCTEDAQLVLAPPDFPRPSLSLAISAANRGEEDKLGVAMSRLAEEDPTFIWRRDPVTSETIITGMADLHLDIMCKRMQERFGVDVETRAPRIAYQESIRGAAKAQGRFKRQTGGRGQFGDCWLEVASQPRGEGFEFVNAIVGGAIPGKFIPSVQKGVEEALMQGVVAGYPFVDAKVTLYDGSYHAVDSSDIAFKIAGSMAFRTAAQQAGPYLLEPIMDLEVCVPESSVGDIIGDLNGKRGRIVGVDPQGAEQVIRAQVPLAEIQRYTTDLRSMSSGRGSFTMEFSHYEEVPAHLTDQIVAEAKGREEGS
ncbi:MAG: elongation factor G [Armatimonadetes bacterium CG_4_10_14_3_um_filter_66_18]|nr:MAG: translation elongation factor G [Armatimonadetes bacterium CG2_30_66_41]PIU94065.1 MAG: elongation factor G [Armatimonadetes bacterium CG06_land_8_20_14_3_00_66_21]PIW13273.1 MAG: elongation factor G [Armatimonadetes bacterium CG17_big_fil_post_rev_8_21_14_2_50_66_6]PIX43079.1 MAG: elongation factor G [Armatimonadetes bacterium CG_4_8_14_3_um_filter_66_20]PIY36201.1 MAG: elongation factor G [Armatimonadetes bacterium CG_4_10_14_3_um_filter_66_18]PIZ50384.1 MAG: elongation factor G [Arm